MEVLKANHFIENFIPDGKENRITQKDLAYVLDVDLRTCRKLVEQARRRGVPICSSTRGYYLPKTAAEAAEYIHTQKARIRTSKAVLKPVEEFVKKEKASKPELFGVDG